jgi:hypothetical protein
VESGNTRATLTATVLAVMLSAALFAFVINSGDLAGPGKSATISSLTICGNSTDILYPELMEAEFAPAGEDWFVTAKFLDDSQGSYNLSIYRHNFTMSGEELQGLVISLLQGIDSASTSEADAMTVLETSPSYAWQIDVSFTGGSWIYLTVWLTTPYAFLLRGTGAPNHNLLDAVLLEPVSAFEPLALAINALFTNHLG